MKPFKTIIYLTVILFSFGVSQSILAHYRMTLNCRAESCTSNKFGRIPVSDRHPHSVLVKCHKPYQYLKTYHVHRHKHSHVSCHRFLGSRTPYSVLLDCTSPSRYTEHVYVRVYCDNDPCKAGIKGIC